MWYQRTITLSEKPRGFHLITDEITDKLSGLPPVETGLLHLLLLHTSASLTLNENCDPTVRASGTCSRLAGRRRYDYSAGRTAGPRQATRQ